MKYPISFDAEFRRNPHSGIYIAIEGIDASGKTTQVEKLSQYFASKNKEFVITSEPRDDGLVGDLIRQVLSGKVKVPSTALQYLYTANRVINHHDIVEPALESNKVVLSSRCFWSAIPYGVMDQSHGDYDMSGAAQIMIAQGILSMYHQFIAPDITFYLQITPNTASVRLSKMDKIKEVYEKKEKLDKISKGYEWLLKEFPEEFVVVDGEKSEEEITKELIQKIEEYKK